MKVQGYMVEATYEDGVLTAHASNKMARTAMAGKMADLSDDDRPALVSRKKARGRWFATTSAVRFPGCCPTTSCCAGTRSRASS
jgi:hypothetical protein